MLGETFEEQVGVCEIRGIAAFLHLEHKRRLAAGEIAEPGIEEPDMAGTEYIFRRIPWIIRGFVARYRGSDQGEYARQFAVFRNQVGTRQLVRRYAVYTRHDLLDSQTQ